MPKKPKKTGNAFIDAIHEAQHEERSQNNMEVRVVIKDGMMAVKPVNKEGKQRGKKRRK